LPEGDTDKALLQEESPQMLDEDDDIENQMVDSSLPTDADTIENILEPRKNEMIERELRKDEQVVRTISRLGCFLLTKVSPRFAQFQEDIERKQNIDRVRGALTMLSRMPRTPSTP
jgi:hypothetical protein